MAAEVSCRDIVLTSGNVRDNSRKKDVPETNLFGNVFIHDNRMLAERAFYCYGIYPVEGIGVFRVPKNGDARNKKPPALRVETKRCTKKSPFRYNRVVQALL